MKKSLIRKYNFPDSELAQKSDVVSGFAERDMSRFGSYNYLEADRQRLITMTTDFKDLPPDEFWEGLKADEVNRKNEKRKLLGLAMNPVRDRIRMYFGEMSALYRSLQLAELSKKSDNEYYFAVRNVHRLATLKKGVLAAKGLTDAMLTDLDTALKTFDNQMDVAKAAESTRAEETENRIIKGNAVYSEMVIVCEMGKSTWADESPAKYQDYVIYETEAGKSNIAGTITNTAGEPVVGAMVEDEGKGDVVAETDENGNYLLTNTDTGAHILLVDADDLESQRIEDVVTRAGQTLVLNIIMKPVSP
jgi:hypothetical protein